MHAQTKAKMTLTNHNCPEEMTDLFHLDQLEEKFGGNVPDVTQYWPPIFPDGEIDYSEDILISEEEYKKKIEEEPDWIVDPRIIEQREKEAKLNDAKKVKEEEEKKGEEKIVPAVLSPLKKSVRHAIH